MFNSQNAEQRVLKKLNKWGKLCDEEALEFQLMSTLSPLIYSRHHGGSIYLLYETIGLSYLFPRGAYKFLFIGQLILCDSLSFMMFAH